MTKVRFEIKSHNENARIYARFQNGRENSFIKKTFLFVQDPKFWDKKNECVADTKMNPAPDKDVVNPKLLTLKGYILNSYRDDYDKGIPINQDWLTKVLLKQSGQEDNVEASKIYFFDYCKEWLKSNSISRINSRTKRETLKVSIKHYENAIQNIQEYETWRKGSKLTFQQIDLAWLKGWVKFMVEEKDYGYITRNMNISNLKTLLTEARSEFYINVNPQFESDKFITIQSEEEKYMEDLLGVYLTVDRINKLFNADLPAHLKPARDLLVISCWTGVRKGDLFGLTLEQLQSDKFIVKTDKTKKDVTVPVHRQIHEILERNNNQLPYKMHPKTYNRQIKLVCDELGFREKVEGVKNMPYTDKISGRKETRVRLGLYPFYQLVTTHIGRKSLGTNLQSVLPIEVAMDIQGWSSRKIAEYYDKERRNESATKVEQYFESIYENVNEMFGQEVEIKIAESV